MADFRFTVSNTGGPARGVEVAVSFDPPLVLQWASEDFHREEGQILWTLDSLPAGGSREFTARCEWTPEGDLAWARVTVTAEGGAKATDEACLRIVTDPEDADGARQALEAVGGRAPQRGTAAAELKRIGVAMHHFHQRWRHFPPAVLRQMLPDAGPPVQAPAPPAGASVGPAVPWGGATEVEPSQPFSWRVALLPYLGHAELYEQYRFDEPWDSPANKKVLDQMPDCYRHPQASPDSTSSAYFVLVGPGTVFDGEEGRRFADVLDGTSYTIQVVEAKRDVPWTKPEDIPYDPEKPLPELGGFTEGGFHVLAVDGAVWFIPESMDEKPLHWTIQRADGHKVFWPSAPPGAEPKPSPEADLPVSSGTVSPRFQPRKPPQGSRGSAY
jgi:hypothetical protein